MRLGKLLSKPTVQRMLVRYYQRGFRDSWQSFDSKPWQHPWLTTDNLRAMREFSEVIRKDARRFRSSSARSSSRHGFVCNIANSMYTTSKALRPLGAEIELFLHPFDDSLMSQPEWEEYDGSVPAGISYTQAVQSGLAFPSLDHVMRSSAIGSWTSIEDMPSWVQPTKYFRWQNFYSFLPLLTRLRECEVLLAIQSPYLAFLSQKPYIVTHMGGDIWYECSRDDQLGQLQRTAFTQAKLCIASNPWSYAFARRYGMRNMVYLPTLLNPDDYSPGISSDRQLWERETGGKFFVLTTARADGRYKGLQIALEGFARFSRGNPEARLIALGWGADLETQRQLSERFGIADKVLVLPTVGKKRLISYLRSADCLLDQFVLGYFGMTALEAMACGVPVIMKLQDAQFDAFSDAGVPPILNSGSVESVAAALTALASDSVFRETASRRSREWFMGYSGKSDWGEAYLDILFAAANGYEFDYARSPLAGPLGRDEESYHADELLKAPTFPNYF
jgi:glycosyltransferase involved in cell wall biosynthesis